MRELAFLINAPTTSVIHGLTEGWGGVGSELNRDDWDLWHPFADEGEWVNAAGPRRCGSLRPHDLDTGAVSVGLQAPKRCDLYIDTLRGSGRHSAVHSHRDSVSKI